MLRYQGFLPKNADLNTNSESHVVNNNNNNRFKVCVLALEDVIRDPLALKPTIVNYWNQDERNGRKCWVSRPVSILTRQEKTTTEAYGGKKCCSLARDKHG